MRNAIAIAKKELNIYFVTPIAYVAFCIMAFIMSIFFVLSLSQFLQISQMAAQMPQYYPPERLNLTDAVAAPLILNAGVILIFVIPFLSMRLFSEEKRQKTFELLMTAPVRPFEIVLGKFLGAALISALTVGLCLLYPIWLHLFASGSGTGGTGGIEWQTVLVGFFGLLLWAWAAMAIGLFVSALTESQVVAAIITFAVLLVTWIIAWGANFSDGAVKDVLLYFCTTQHLVNFAKGILDLKDILFYVSIIVLALFLTHRAVEAQRWA